jgi:hypothetical protein
MVALLLGPVVALGPVAPANAATMISPTGFWDCEAYIADWGPTYPADKAPGGPFLNATTITSFDPATGAYSGTDRAWGIGLETVTGTFNTNDGTEAWTTIGPHAVVHGQAKVTVNPDGTITTSGTWSNTIGQTGTVGCSLKDSVLRGTVEKVSCGAGETSCPVPPVPVPDVKITVAGPESASVTTGDDGDYTMYLQPGTYTVTPRTPGREVMPTSRRVDLTASKGDVDFQTFDTALSVTDVTRGTSASSADVRVELHDFWTDASGCDPSASYHFDDPGLTSAKQVSPCKYELTFDDPGTGIYHVTFKATDRLGYVTPVSVDQFGRTVSGKFGLVIDSCSEPADDVPDVDALLNADDDTCDVTVGDWDTDAAGVADKVIAGMEGSPSLETDPVPVESVDPSDFPSRALVLQATGWVPIGTGWPPGVSEEAASWPKQYSVGAGDAVALVREVTIPGLPKSWGGACDPWMKHLENENDCKHVDLDDSAPATVISAHGLWFVTNGLVRVPAGDQITTFVPIGTKMLGGDDYGLGIDVDTGNVYGDDTKYLHVYTPGQLMPDFTFVPFDGIQGKHVLSPESPITLNNLINLIRAGRVTGADDHGPGEGKIWIATCAQVFIPDGYTLGRALTHLPVHWPGSNEAVGYANVALTSLGTLVVR